MSRYDLTSIMYPSAERLVELVGSLVTAGLPRGKALEYVSRTFKCDIVMLDRLVREYSNGN